MYIADITVTTYRFRPRPRCVQYALTTRGLTVYLHPMTLYDADSCLSRDFAAFTHWKRFSSIAKMHKDLCKEFPTVELPKFPRHWFRVRSPKAIQRRIEQLNNYFSALTERLEVRYSLTLLNFFQPVLKLTVRVVGVAGIGKMRVLEAFFAAGKDRLKESIPSLHTGNFLESGTYPDRMHIPIDLVVDQHLVRLCLLSASSLSESESFDLEETDGLIFAFSEEVPESYERARVARRELDVESAIVALDVGMDISGGQFSMSSVADIYGVFEYLVQRHLMRLK